MRDRSWRPAASCHLNAQLAETARERGVRAFHCELAQGNWPVLGLVHEAVPGLWPQRGKDGVVALEVPLPAMP